MQTQSCVIYLSDIPDIAAKWAAHAWQSVRVPTLGMLWIAVMSTALLVLTGLWYGRKCKT